MNDLAKTVDYVEVPYLEELLKHLPINAIDKKDVNTYLQNITDSIRANYDNEQYQFAYFGFHLLYMTYIYFSVRKISIILPERYKDAVVFAKPYHGQDLDFNNIESVFDYSLVAERELPNILKIIGLDNGQIGKIGNLVDDRNYMAHATGRFSILNEDALYAAVNGIYDSVRNIHNRMDKQIRSWFSCFLLKYCNNGFEGYNNLSDIEDIIVEQMIQGFNISTQELLVCSEMSMRKLTTENPEHKEKLKVFKDALKKYCKQQEFIG